MASLQEKIEQVVSDSEGKWGIIVQDVSSISKPALVEINPDQLFEAASIAKLGIVLRVLHQVERQGLWWNEPLKLKEDHKRGGTGVLRYFPAGFMLSLKEAVGLMLMESDNTAVNTVLDEINGQQIVNRYLRGKLQIRPTGLSDRVDRVFESDVITPAAAMLTFGKIFSHPQFQAVVPFMYRSHFTYGLRRQLYPAPSWRQYQGTVIGPAARLIGHLPCRPGLNGLLWLALHHRTNSLIANKEGSLDYQGEGYRHEVALQITVNGPLLVAAFSRGWPLLGYTTDHPACRTLGQIGWEIHNHR